MRGKGFLLVTLILFTCCLTSCGFHLRGATTLAPALQRLYIKTKDPYGELTRYLTQYLKMSGVYLASSSQDATAVLEILSEQMDQTLVGVSGTQQTRQYNLTLSVKFQITTPDGAIISAPEVLSEARTLPINSGEVLASSNQATSLYHQMRRAVVFDIMNRISSQDMTNKLAQQTRHA